MTDSSVHIEKREMPGEAADRSFVAARGFERIASPAWSSHRRRLVAAATGLALVLGLGGQALALDPSALVSPDSGPTELFSFGFSAYKRGEKSEAAEALRYAADKGHPGARWKLGRMYADGDGVPENDYEAFKIFQEIVNDDQDDTAASPNAAYVANSVTALADYLRTGIPDTPVRVDLSQARQLYFHAASIFGDSQAQYRLGQMLLKGEGGRANPRQAARWLNLAAEKGHIGAQALLGYLLFDGEQIDVHPEPVRGLALLTIALRNARPIDQDWIRPMQEEAFSLASEGDRRTALAYAQSKQNTIARN